MKSPQPGAPAIAERVRRFSALLQRRIRSAGFTQRQVERELGWNPGYVSQLLRGNQDIKLRHALAILDAIGADASHLLADLAAAANPAAGSGLRLASPPRGEAAPTGEQSEAVRKLLAPYVRTLVLEALQKGA